MKELVEGSFCCFNNLRFRCAEVKLHLYIERTQINRYEISYFPHFILQYSFISCSVSYLVAQLPYNSLSLSFCLSELYYFGSFEITTFQWVFIILYLLSTLHGLHLPSQFLKSITTKFCTIYNLYTPFRFDTQIHDTKSFDFYNLVF